MAKKTIKPTTIPVHTGKPGKLLPDEKAYRGRVTSAGPSRITVEIEIADDHPFRKGEPVLLIHDADTALDETAARIDETKAAETRALLKSPGMRGAAGDLLRELLKRRRRLQRTKA